jgi:hypothetical protein
MAMLSLMMIHYADVTSPAVPGQTAAAGRGFESAAGAAAGLALSCPECARPRPAGPELSHSS